MISMFFSATRAGHRMARIGVAMHEILAGGAQGLDDFAC